MSARLKTVLPPTLTVVGVLVLWQALVHLLEIPRFILPPPLDIAEAVVANRAILVDNMWVTLLELGLGYGLGVGTGLVLAILMNFAKPVKAALYPLVVASQTIPKVAIAPLFVLWFGVDLTPKVLIVALLAFFPVLINTISGLDSTDAGQVELLRSVNASAWDTYRYVKIPSAVPYVFAGLKLALTVSVIGAVIAEFVASNSGLGYLLLAYNASLQTTELFATLVVLITISGLSFILLTMLERAFSWQQRVRSPRRRRAASPARTTQGEAAA